VRYLPAYNPDLNPIEQAFAKLKAVLRKTAARTFATLVEAIADALGTFTPEECENYIINSGYHHQSRKCSGLPFDVLEAGIGYAASCDLPRREGTIQLHPEPCAKLPAFQSTRCANGLATGGQMSATSKKFSNYAHLQH
jgi:hypothetical protein